MQIAKYLKSVTLMKSRNTKFGPSFQINSSFRRGAIVHAFAEYAFIWKAFNRSNLTFLC